MKNYIVRLSIFLVLSLVLLGVGSPATARAASSSEIAEAQRIMTKFTIPTGPVDGIWGAKTAQGICTFRQISGLPVSRGAITTNDMAKLRGYNSAYSSLNKIPAASRNGHGSYLLATKTCQTMIYVASNKFTKVFRVSTGAPGYDTPVGNFMLGSTKPGWSCSTIYPEGCAWHTEGMNAKYNTKGVLYSKWGHMYNKRSISGSYMLHGSMSVPTYPASHGCVRTTVADSDWLYTNVSNASGTIYMSIVGAY